MATEKRSLIFRLANQKQNDDGSREDLLRSSNSSTCTFGTTPSASSTPIPEVWGHGASASGVPSDGENAAGSHEPFGQE